MAVRNDDDRNERNDGDREQFEKDPFIQEQLGILKEFTSDYTKGHIFLWEIIEGLLGLDRRSARLQYVMQLWSKHMFKDRRIITDGVHGRGVKLLLDNEVTGVKARKRMRRAYRQHTRVVKELKEVDLGNLTDHEMKLRIATLDSSREAAAKARAAIRRTTSKPDESRESLVAIALAKAKERAAADSARAAAADAARATARAARQQSPVTPTEPPTEPPTAPAEGGTEPTPQA